jgi:endonuclease-8
VGATVTRVQAQGKHLVLSAAGPEDQELVLHTHLGMKGTWQVRPAGGRWFRPPSGARVILEAADHHAGCFGAPLIELVSAQEWQAPLARGGRRVDQLGPDAVTVEFSVEEAVRRARLVAMVRPEVTVGEILLDQRVAAGIGNVYRCEVLFLGSVSPFWPAGAVDAQRLRGLFQTATRMLRHNAGPGRSHRRDTGLGPGQSWVHRRAGRPCRRCGTIVRSDLLGAGPRRIYWCPRCQALDLPPVSRLPSPASRLPPPAGRSRH